MKLAQKIAIGWLRLKFKLVALVSKKLAARQAVRLFCTPQVRTKSKTTVLFNGAEKLHFDFDGITIHGYRWNHPSATRVLILHGLDSSVTNFEQYLTLLIQKGYEVLAFDAPAHGKSGGNIITALIYRDMILAVYENYGPIHFFIAHSLGGLALMLALEKIKHNNDNRIVLIAPATESVTAFDNFFNFLQLKNERLRDLFDQSIVKMTGHPLSWFSITRAMEHITANVLWLHDDADKITPLSDTLAIKEKNYPGVKFVITHGLGHRRIYRDKKVVNLAVDFLS